MGLLSLSYRRPEYVDPEEFRRDSTTSDGNKSNASLSSGRSGASSGIPDALTFDKIINGGTCPPSTIRDFMDYLIYIEHAAENLQFFLWYRDYVKRFNEAAAADVALAPEWTQAMEEEAYSRIQKDAAEQRKKDPPAAAIFKGTDFEKSLDVILDSRDPFSTPPRTPTDEDALSFLSGSQATTYRTQAGDTFTAAGAKQPFTIQPFRAEIDRILATYIAPSAPRQLNLSAREQKAATQALSYTTHPSALRGLAGGAEGTLRRQAHPNFVRWAVRNGNPARVAFARGLGASAVLLSTAGAVLLALGGAGRGWRALLALGWAPGIATLAAAARGMCVVLHGLHRRHVRPWELFVDEAEESRGKGSFESFGSSNGYEDEPWVVRYDRRNVVRKVFDREVWIREPALRQVQDTIFVQSVLCGLLGAGVLTAVFVAVPGGGFY